MPTNYVAPTVNFLSKTLNGAITDAASTITLSDANNIQAPGYAVIDRTDSNGTSTPNAREVITYTGVSGSNLTGVARNADNSTARSHSDGAIVEFTPTIGMWNSLATIVASGFTSDGYLRAIASPVSIAIGRFIQFDTVSIASIARVETSRLIAPSALVSIATILGHLTVSGASLSGIPMSPAFIGSGNYSGPTTAIGGILNSPRAYTLSWVSAVTRFVVSTASIGFDFKVREASIFANATSRPAIIAGGTYVSTASLATRNINPGDLLQGDIASVGSSGYVTQITIQAG